MKNLIRMSTLLIALCGAAHASEENDAGPKAGKSMEELTAPCVACHGKTGVSNSGAFPTIAGQHASYIEKTLLDYQSGARKNPIMAGQVGNLSKADIKALARYYAQQEGPLYTPAYE